MRANLLASATSLAALAVALGCLMVLVFDWSWSYTVLWGLTGAALWGALDFFINVRHQVPEGTRLVAAPSDVMIDRDGRRPLRMVLWLPVFLGLAWLVDRWDLGALFIPGQFAGYALASLAGGVLVGRWQNRHGGTVLLRWNSDEPELYVR